MGKVSVIILLSCLNCSLRAQPAVGVLQNSSAAFNGYTLFAPNASTTTYLIDNCGRIINSWASDHQPGSSAYLLDDGSLLRTARIPSNFNAGGAGGKIERFDWEGNLIWEYTYSTNTYHQHHDIEPLPNGNILVLAWDKRTPGEALQAGRNPATFDQDGIWGEKIAELEPVGTDEANVLWQWFLWDHLIQDFDTSKSNYGIVSDHPELADINFTATPNSSHDWIHANSIDYNPQLDQIMLSSRTFNEILVIDHSTTSLEASGHQGGNSGMGGDIIYRWGNPISYQRGTIQDKKLFGQHDAHWIEAGLPDAGKIMVFNNGLNRPEGNYSTIDVIAPPLNSDGNYILEAEEAFGPSYLFWSYQANNPTDFFSDRISGAQRQTNGNTLICAGRSGNFFEVDMDGSKVWNYIVPLNQNGPVDQDYTGNLQNEVFRSYRYALDYPAFENVEIIPGDVIETNATSDCEIYTVTEEAEYDPAVFRLLNNPFQDILQIENTKGKTIQLDVFSMDGKKWHSTTLTAPSISIPAHQWPPGLLFLRITTQKNPKIFTYKILKL